MSYNTHGFTTAGRKPVEYKAWENMIQRCSNPRHPAYHNYGGRGVTVCSRWLSFVDFLKDMGPRPAGMTLERVDNNGNYEPGNCRWATKREQARNRRTRSTKAVLDGKDASHWAEVWGVRYDVAWHRIVRAQRRSA